MVTLVWETTRTGLCTQNLSTLTKDRWHDDNGDDNRERYD